MKTIREIIEERLYTIGCVEISGGYWLHTQENIIQEQKIWDENDEAKKFDFTEDNYWLIYEPNSGDTKRRYLSFYNIDEALVYYFN